MNPPAPSSRTARIPAHPSHRLFTGIAAFGAFLFVLATALLLTGAAPATSILCASLGGTLAVWGMYGRATGAGVQVVNTSFNLVTLGRFAEAEPLLDQVEKQSRIAVVNKAARTQRVIIAMRRGHVPEALRAADAAIAAPLGLFGRAQSRMQTVNAQAIRAFLRASAGDRDGAKSDIAAVRSDPRAIPQALGRVALAEAVLLERSGDRTALREHLARERTLLLEGTDRRERSIVRAYQRMLKAAATTPYRKPVPKDAEAPSGEEPPLAHWIETLVPGAAAYAKSNLRRGVSESSRIEPLEKPSEAAQKAVAQARAVAAKASTKRQTVARAATVGILVAIFLAFFAIFSTNPDSASPALGVQTLLESHHPLSAFLSLLIVIFVGLVVFNYATAHKQSRRLLTAMQGLTKGEIDQAEKQLTGLASSRLPIIAASAYLGLATIAERRADLANALSHCDQGLGKLARYASRVAASDILLPELVAERAFILTAMDRTDEAHAEIASFGAAYPYLARARFRVHLLELIRRGDLPSAAQLARNASADLPLSPHDELLADAACAAVSPELAGAGELGRIREEVRVPEVRRWIYAVAPNVLAALEKIEFDPELLAASAPGAAEAESEALAEEEARLGLKPQAPRTKSLRD
jgi:hypothetical protein